MVHVIPTWIVSESVTVTACANRWVRFFFSTAYCHSMNALESQRVAADHISNVLSAVGAMSLLTHVMVAVAVFVDGVYFR